MKIAIATDSNSGITQAQAKELGVYVLPMPFVIDGMEYLDGVTLDQEMFYQKLGEDAEVSTSQPSPESVMGFWDEILKDHDAVVYIPMSSGLSGSCQTAKMLSEEYDGKVFVADNHRISITQRQSVLDALKMAEQGMTVEAICEKLEETGSDSTIYIMVDTLKYLKKGGRLTPAVAAIGTLLRIKPILTIQGEKLDSYAKARTLKQSKSAMIAAIQNDLAVRFGDTDGSKCEIQVAHSFNEEEAVLFRQELEEVFPKAENIIIAPLSLSVACHIGPGSLAAAATKKVEL